MGLWDMFQGFGESLEDWGGSSGNYGLGDYIPSFSDSFKGLDMGGFPTRMSTAQPVGGGGFGGRFSSFFQSAPFGQSPVQNWVSRFVTGQNLGDIATAVAKPAGVQFPLAQIQGAYRPLDKRMHAYSSYLSNNKWGGPMTRLFGLGNEVFSLLGGQGLEDSYNDMIANELGILLSNQNNPYK